MTSLHRVALVTGAARGIGAAIARRLTADGVSVIVADIQAEAVRNTAEHLGARPITLDVASADSITATVALLEAEYGVLDVLVNCAGISDTTPTSSFDSATYRRTLDVNLNGAVELTLALLPLLRRSAAGRILNIGSIQGFRGAPNSLAYATSKAGMLNFTRSLAADVASDGILVNALAPGFIDTPMAMLEDGRTEYQTEWFQDVYVTHGRIPLRRPGRPDEVAEAAEFFVSARNGYVTGQVLAVDGGMTATF